MDRTFAEAAVSRALAGPKVDRSHERARAGIPMNADEARSYLTDLHRGCRNLASRRTIVSAALRIGRLDDGAKAVYRAYLDAISGDGQANA